MSFQITVKNCQPIAEKLKPTNLYCNIRIGDDVFKTGVFKGKGDVAVWNHSFSATTRESFLKVELWEDGFFQDTLHGDYIVNISKYYSTPGMPHNQFIVISKQSKQIAQINLEIKYVREGYGKSNPVQAVEASMSREKQPAKPYLQHAKNYEKEPAKPNRPARFNDSAYDMPVPFTSGATHNLERNQHRQKPSAFNVPFGVGGGGNQQKQQRNAISSHPSQENLKKKAKQPNRLPSNPYQQKVTEQQQYKIGVPPSQPPPRKENEPKKQPVNQRIPQQQMHAQNQYHFAPSQSQHHYNSQQAMQANQFLPMGPMHPGMAVQPTTQMSPLMGMPPIDMNNLGMLLAGEATIGTQGHSHGMQGPHHGMHGPPHGMHYHPGMWDYPPNFGYPTGWGMGWY